VIAALAAAQHTPQLVVRQVIAAVEVADPVGAFVGGPEPVGMVAGGPAGAVAGADRQRPELVEREASCEALGGDLFDAVQFGLVVRVGGLLPGAGPLEGDVMAGEDLP
jgi:hypothetical protein